MQIVQKPELTILLGIVSALRAQAQVHNGKNTLVLTLDRPANTFGDVALLIEEAVPGDVEALRNTGVKVRLEFTGDDVIEAKYRFRDGDTWTDTWPYDNNAELPNNDPLGAQIAHAVMARLQFR